MTKIQQLKNLWKYCFHDSDSYIDWFFSNWYGRDIALTREIDGKIAAALYTLPYTVRLRGESYKGGYIVGVSTAPEARGQGLAGALLRESLASMRAKGWALSPLYPFDYAYYRKFGWALACNAIKFHLPLEKLYGLRPDKGLRMRPLMPGDIPALCAAHGRWLGESSLHVVRDPETMEKKVREALHLGGYGYVIEKEGRVAGYTLFYMESGVLEVSELVYDELDVLLGLLAFFASHQSSEKEVSLTLPAHCNVLAFLPDLRGFADYVQHAMLRIVDIERIRMPGETVYMLVRDAQAPWNDGVFALSPEGCRRTEGTPCAEVDIATLAQLAIGYISAGEALSMGQLLPREGFDLAALKKKWPVSKSTLLDMY